MPDTTIRIIIQMEGSAQSVNSIKGIGAAAATAASPLKNINSLLAVAFGGGAIAGIVSLTKKITDLGDEFIVFRNRINFSTNSQEEATRVMAQLLAIAQDTGTPISVVGEAFSRLSISLQEMGQSGDTAVGITESLLQTFTAVSGSASAASAAVTQLSVAFGQGTLTGRQFRTLIGSSPLLVSELSKAVGLTTSELRSMGAQGKLSADLLVSAFRVAGPEINNLFSTKFTSTFENELDKIKNTFVEISNQPLFRKSITESLKESLSGVNSVIRSINGLSVADESNKILAENRAVLAAAQEQRRLTTTLPTAVSSGQREFLDTLNKQLDTRKKLGDAALFQSKVDQAALTVENQLRDKGLISQEKAEQLLAQGTTFLQLHQKGFTVISNQQYFQAINAAKYVETEKIQLELLNQNGGSLGEYNEKLEQTVNLGERHLLTLAQVQETTLKIQAARLVGSPTAESAQQRGALLIGLEQQDQRGIADAMVKSFKDADKGAKEYNQTLIAVQTNLKNGAITQAQFNDQLEKAQIALLENNKDTFSGFERGFLKVHQEINDFASAAENVVTNAFHSMEDALVSFVQTGKFSFSGLVDSLLADMTRLVARQVFSAILNTFTGGAGGAVGGIVGAIAGGGARAAGGPVSTGQRYLVGENGPEVFQPNQSGRIIPNGGGGAGGTSVHVTNVVDRDSIIGVLNDPKAHEHIVNIISVNRKSVKQILA